MAGILIFTAVGLWLSIAAWLSRFMVKKLPMGWWRAPTGFLLFFVIVPLPVADEIIGSQQFDKLCKNNSGIQVDRAKAAGKTVYLAKTPDEEIKGTWVRIVLKPWRFVDARTGETVVSYNTLMASGGWLVQHIGFSEGKMPLVFHGSCVPKDRPGSIETFKPYEIEYIEPPIKNQN